MSNQNGLNVRGKKRRSLSSGDEESESKELEKVSNEFEQDGEEPSPKRRKLNLNAHSNTSSLLSSPARNLELNVRPKHDHDCKKHKIRKRIQFYTREPLSNDSDNVKLVFQFKHSFCDNLTFRDLLFDIAPKLGRKIKELKNGEYLLECLNNGQISLYSHIDGPNVNDKEKNDISNWDEILDFDENVIDIVVDSNESLTLLQNQVLKTNEKKIDKKEMQMELRMEMKQKKKHTEEKVKSQEISQNKKKQKEKEKEKEMEGTSDANKKKKKKKNKEKNEMDEGDIDIDIGMSNRIKMKNDFGCYDKNVEFSSLEVRFWDDSSQFESCIIDMPLKASVDELKHQLSNVIGVPYRNHSSNILASLNNNLYETNEDKYTKEKCLCMSVLMKSNAMAKAKKSLMNKRKKQLKLRKKGKDKGKGKGRKIGSNNKQGQQEKENEKEEKEEEEKFAENTVYFYHYQTNHESQAPELVGTEFNDINFAQSTVKDVCNLIEAKCKVWYFLFFIFYFFWVSHFFVKTKKKQQKMPQHKSTKGENKKSERKNTTRL